MKKHLVPNWKQVLREAWSVRFTAAAAVFSGLEIALPLMIDIIPVMPGTFAAISGINTALALVARVISQRSQ